MRLSPDAVDLDALVVDTHLDVQLRVVKRR
jgi:hypothetical protein